MRNRVTPMGDLVAVSLRGAWCGNRGILHRGTDVVRFHASDLWITCALSFKDWRLPQWEPGHFTLLFFHDEAVSLAAGHRPCALCRRPAYDAYRRAIAASADIAASASARSLAAPTSPANCGKPVDVEPGDPATFPHFAGGSAKELNRQLHAERLHRGTHRRRWHRFAWSDVPDGAFVLYDGVPSLVLGAAVVPWSTTGYGAAHARPTYGEVAVMTPPTSVAALRGGYLPQIDSTARTPRDLREGG